MSQQINCPHCGFVNFAISAYCGRCERPLPPPEAAKPEAAGAPIRAMPPRAPSAPPPPPPNAAPPARPSTPPIERIRAHQAQRPAMISQEPTQALPRHDVLPPRRLEPTATQVQARPEPTATQIAPRPMPVPIPHDDATVVRAVAVPQEARAPDKFDALYEEAVASQPRQSRAREEEPRRRRPLDEGPLEMGDGSPELADAADSPELAGEAPRRPIRMDTDPTMIPASRPAYWRLVGAFAIDAGLVLALGAAVVGSEMALFAGHWPVESGPLAALGEWLSLYPGTALRALAVMASLGLAYATWGARHGATLGRHAARLLALHQNGQRLSWGRALARSLLSMVSLVFFGAGYFWAVVDRRKRAWHDILAGSVVVHHRVR